MKYYTGVGSRETPEHILKFIEEVAYWFDWFIVYQNNFERRYKYIKALIEWKEFLDIKRRNK